MREALIIIIIIFLMYPYYGWFKGANISDWFLSGLISISIPALIIFLSYIIIEKFNSISNGDSEDKVVSKYHSLNTSFYITFLFLALSACFSIIYLNFWYYSGEGAFDTSIGIQLKSFRIAGVLIFSSIWFILLAVFNHNDFERINPFSKPKQKFDQDEKNNEYLLYYKNILEERKEYYDNWLKSNDIVFSYSSKMKAFITEIEILEPKIKSLIQENYKFDNCKKCNTEYFNLLDTNSSGTGIEIQCTKCMKKSWSKISTLDLSDKDEIHDSIIRYFEILEQGISLSTEYYNAENEYYDIYHYKDLNHYIKKIIEYDERYDETGILKKDALRHQLDPKNYDPKNVFYYPGHEITNIEDNYICVFADERKKSDNQSKRKPIPKTVQREVWRRDEGKCIECGINEKLEYDHIIPHSKGGADTVRNIQLLCESCNRTKSAKIG